MKIIIIGIGSTAISIADIITREHNYEIEGFIGTEEENKKFYGKKIYHNIPFLGTRNILKEFRKYGVSGFVVGIADNYLRELSFYECVNEGLIPINAISGNAIVENEVKLKKGIVISSGSIIQHGVEISDNTIISSGSIIDFKSKIHENCFISPGCIIGSNSEIKKNVLLGPRVIVGSDISVGKNQKIESNSIVKENLKDLPRRS